jgi:hypothetical protein
MTTRIFFISLDKWGRGKWRVNLHLPRHMQLSLYSMRPCMKVNLSYKEVYKLFGYFLVVDKFWL